MSLANIDLTAKKLAEQKRKREAALKELGRNVKTSTGKTTNKNTKFSLPREEEETSKSVPYESLYNMTPEGEIISETKERPQTSSIDKTAPRKVTVEKYIPTKEETPKSVPYEPLYNMTPEGKPISETKVEVIPGFKHFVTDIINSNEIYQIKDDFLGVEHGESISKKENLDTYEEILSNPDIVSKLRDKAMSNFSLLNPNKDINPYKVDMMVRDVVKTRIAQEQNDKKIEDNLFIEQESLKGNYVPVLNEGTKRHMEEIDPSERLIAANVKLAHSLQKVMNDNNASNESRNKAALDLQGLGTTLQDQLKKYDSDYSFMFDNATGRRLSKAEVDNRNNTGEENTMSDRENEVKSMKALHADQDLESLERGYFTHINRYNNYNKKANIVYDINPSDSYIRTTLYNKGYRFKPNTTTFQGVKAKDLVRFMGQNTFAKDIEKGISSVSEKGVGSQITGSVTEFLKDLAKEKSKLEIERDGYKTSYLMNIDPKSLKQTALGTAARFLESVSDATIGDKATREIGVTDRKELDEIKEIFSTVGITPSKEQTEAFKRSTSMKVAEGVGSFVPELVKFAAINAVTGGVLGTTGFGARIAALGRSKSIYDKMLFLGFNTLKEEITFKTATLGESHTLGGAGFHLGGQAMNKLVPFRFGGALARFNPFIEKVALAGPGMVVGSEGAALAEAAYKEMRGKKAFRTSMEDMYGENSEWADRMVVNAWVGGIIGGHHLKRMDLKSMSSKRSMFDKVSEELYVLKSEDNPANAKKIEQKKNTLALLGREIEVADRNFINQDIGPLKEQINDIQSKIDKHNNSDVLENKLSNKELSEAEDQVAKGQATIVAVRRSIERNFKAATAKGDIANGVKLEIMDGSKDSNGVERVDADENAKFFPDNNTIYLDINKNRKGILGHELGHAIMKAAFDNDSKIAEKFKETIKKQVETALAGRRFVGNKTFEEAINEAYKDDPKMLAEEYIMNVVDFIQKPKNRDVLLSTDLLPTLKRSIGELGTKIGIDLTSNKPLELGKKNLNRASDLLEFLYDLGNVAGGKSATALKNKFERFKDITIDGKKLININTGKEITTKNNELNEIEAMASKNISENEKKDIFSKATRAYEESMANGDSPEIAGLMVGMEMEPLIRKQVEGYLTSKGITMSRDKIQDIVDSLTTDSGTATFGVPNLTEAWSKGQTLIEYIKTENPSREAINSKAKELVIQDRTSAGSESSTIDKYIKMAKGETEQAQLTSYIFGNLPKRILQTLQKSEFADTFNTFSIEDVQNIDKLEESAGISGASSSSEQGYIDISSPEKYTRDSQKNAETILELPAPLVEKINNDANKFLNSQKLENLDAKAVGTVPLKDGGKAKVAMLESDKARITYPDGRVETIKARSPKLVEQHLGAPEKSFEKDFNFKEGLSEDFKNSLFNDLSEHAGNIIDNKKATPKYESFIDNAFPLFKTFLSQYSVNKRFADFKEPYMDPATGKQAREKTAAGNPIFTKKNITLAEWRKYFLGDGTQRIDGKRRSIIDALAVELGFDATMNVLGKEAMREQVESRQEALSAELIENYVAVIAKQLDRGTPDSMASKIIYEISNQIDMSKERVTGNLQSILFDKDGNLKHLDEIAKSKLGGMYLDMVENLANKDVLKNTLSIKKGQKVNFGLKTKLRQRKVDVSKETLQSYKNIRRLSEAELKEYNQFAVNFISTLPKEILNLTTSDNGAVLYSVVSELFGYTGRRSFKIKNKSDNKMLYFGRLDFENLYEGATRSKEGDGMSKELQKRWNGWVEKVTKNTPEGRLPTVVNKTTKFFKEVEKIQKLNISREEKIKMVLETPGLKEATADIQIKSEFLELFLSTIGEKSKNLTKPELEKLSKNVAVLLLNNDGTGIRKFSAENYMDLSLKSSEEIKNEHLKARTTFAADVLEHVLNGTLNEQTAKTLTDSYISLVGGKSGQDIADAKFGKTIEGFNYEKMAMAQWFNMGVKGRVDAKIALSNILNIKTGKTAWEELVEKKIINDFPTTSELKDIKDIEIDKPMASKNLAEDLSSMIERKKGIPAGEEISAAKASILGRKKGNFEFFVPANAEDFAGLLYKFYGKGKQGNADMALLKEKLLDPFERGENAISTYRQKLSTDLKAMDAQLNELGGKVTKESKEALKESGFDADQATRVYIWKKQGVEIPDITPSEVTELSDIVKNDARLRSYADGVMGLVEFPPPTDSWYASNLKYDLYKHSTEGVRKDFLVEWKENMDEMFTANNYLRMEASYGKDFTDNFKQLTKRMETGKARPENIGKIAQKGLDWINGSVGVIMWMNTRSAVLQTVSAVNYVNWSDNNVLAAGKTFANPIEFAKTFKELMNSDFLKQRRDGLEINIEDAEIAKAIEKGGNAPERLFGKLIKAGFKPTQIADSFAIAVGGTPFYINRTKTYQKEVIIDKKGNSTRKYTDTEAKQKAFDDFRALSEEHQQSSRPDRVSNVQLGVLGRLVFAFNNTPMQMTRLQKKAALDLINRRGDDKTNVSKIVYYGLIQSAIFHSLQQAAFGLMFGNDDDELKEGEAAYLATKKENKSVSVANAMIDSFISGSGMTGKLLVTAKNTLLKYNSESAKGYTADYGKVINEGFSISPPLSSKTKKAYSAFSELKYAGTKKGKKEAEKKGYLNSPQTIAGSKLIAVTTNIPLDRFITKVGNLATSVAGENVEDWQRISLLLGWDKYSLGMYEDPYLDPTEQAASDSISKEESAADAKVTRDAKKAEKDAIYESLPQSSKDSIDYVNFKTAESKSKNKFIKEEVRKSKLTKEQAEYEKHLAKEKRAKSKEKYKINKVRNQKLKDSINYANKKR